MTRWLTGGPAVVNGGPPPLTGGQAVVNGGPPPLTGGTRYRLTCQYEVRGCRTRQYEVLFRWRLDQSERDTWHWRVSVRGVRVSVRGQACMDPCQSLAIMRRLVECKKDYNTPRSSNISGRVLERMKLPLPLGGYKWSTQQLFEGTDMSPDMSVQGTRYEVAGHVSTRYCSGGGWTNQSVTRGTGMCQYEVCVCQYVVRRVWIRANHEAVGGVQKDYNTPRSSNMSGEVLERTKLPLPLRGYKWSTQ
ncbi:hypothetical protein Tco_1513894 [Tanacetum coccineum]